MAGPNQTPGPTAIRAPTPDLSNHQTVLTQLKETTETAQRLRGNPLQSYVTLGELISAGIIKFLGGVVSPGDKIAKGGSGTVHVLDSITGDGSTGTPLQLSGDSASPGNTMLYGTNGSGTKGWYAQPGGGGGSLTVTDGTNSVTGTTHLQFSGATVSGTTPNAVVTISGGGSVPLPGTIPDLVTWFAFDNILATAGNSQPALFDRTPWRTGAVAAGGSSSTVISATKLNGLNTLTWTASVCTLNAPFFLNKGATYFIVLNPQGPTTNQAIMGSQSGGGGCSLYISTGTTGNISIVDPFIAIIASSTATWVAGTWFQANVTYNPVNGAFIFRQNRTAANSGTSATLGAGTTNQEFQFGADDGGQNLVTGTKIAEFIAYNRVLTPTEVTNVENYLFAKWGV